jgi:putative SOS response-associated peptidase YedK
MIDGCEQMSDVHDRMPVILKSDQCEQWTQGTPAEATDLVRTADCPLLCERTEEFWLKPRKAKGEGSLI